MNKISIIVPFYNVEKYASKCIESIINQTYKNLEIILVDDGSKDNCGKICDEFAKKDKRIKVIHKTNGGLSDARNAGIKEATGNYIGFVDSDDYIESDMYEYLLNLLEKNNADISICGVGEVYEDFEEESIKTKEDVIIYDNKEALKELLLDKKIRSHAWDKLYKKELFNNIFYPKGRKMEDVGTTYKLFNKANRIVYGEKIKYHYLQRKNSIMGKNDTNMWIDYYELSTTRYEEIKKIYPDLIENDIALLSLIMYMYSTDDQKLIEFLKNKNVKNQYNEMYSNRLLVYNIIDKRIKFRLLLLHLSTNIYRFTIKYYLKKKGKRTK